MTFRGYLALNGTELVNSSRVIGHLGYFVPTQDLGIIVGVPPEALLIESPPGSGLYLPGHTPDLGGGYYDPGDMEEFPPGSGLYLVVPSTADQCALTPAEGHPGLFEMPDTAEEIRPGIWSPPNGSRRWGKAMLLVGDMCWQEAPECKSCRTQIGYDDSWPGLHDYLSDTIYRTELAPWHSTRQPESTEFMGIWVTELDGLGPVQVQRTITEMIGNGGAAGPHRDATRTVTVKALLLACTNAGLEYGLDWLTCRLRETNDNTDSVLRFLNAHPSHTAATVDNMVREAHGVVLTKSPEVTDQFAPSNTPNQQATMYVVTWEMAVTSPYVYLPPIELPVDWDVIAPRRINWVHAADCQRPDNCDPMPVLFSTECVPEEIEVVTSPPPTCGGCMPVCEIDKHFFQVPTMDFPVACTETAVNLTFTNTGTEPLTLQGYWRVCNTDIRCEDNRWPVTIKGLPAGASLTLHSISGRYWATVKGRVHRPVGIVDTPNGAPWRPIILDRTGCWEFVVLAPDTADFTVQMQLVDRAP